MHPLMMKVWKTKEMAKEESLDEIVDRHWDAMRQKEKHFHRIQHL
jgi:hypothetical protein